jgi:drug/metabolite transporter (DMT)-like permease
VWWEGTLIGIPRIGLAPTLFISSLQFISAGFESIIITLIPAVTAAMGAVWLNERLNRLQIIGLVIGLAGAVILIASGESGLAEGGNAVVGGLLALGGVVAGAASGILARKYAPDHATAELAGPMFVSGALVAFAASFLFEGVQIDTVSSTGWWILVALALGSTLLPFVATLYSAKHVTATVTSLTGYVAPLVGVIGGVLILDEVLTTGILVGGALTLLGVIVVGRAQAVSRARIIA